jgi:hypothetical protein
VAAHDTCCAWREGAHDDLVLACAVACWYAEHEPPRAPEYFSTSGYSAR